MTGGISRITGTVGNLTSAIGTIGGSISTGVNVVNRLASDLGLNGPSSQGANWIENIRAASFRGVPFGVLEADTRYGRRIAEHIYPFRNVPYAEDIGRSARRYTVTAFLISDSAVYGGGNVLAQRDQLVAACETAGPGRLIHPTLGTLNVSIADGGLCVTEKWNNGRYFEISLSFIESGQKLYPGLNISTGDAVATSATTVAAASSSSFLSQALTALKQGSSVIQQAVGTAQMWARQAQGLANDATNLYNMVGTLQGNFSRYFGGRNSGGFSAASNTASASTTIDQLIAAGAQARAAVTATANTLVTDAGTMGGSTTPSTTASDAQALAAALLAATVDPADAIRLLSNLADFTPSAPVPNSQIGVAMGNMQSALGDLFRRAAVTALAMAASIYQPSSSNDALNIRTSVTALLDNEITVAGDQGEDDVFAALRALRIAVVTDLTVRGANLAPIATFKFNAPLPSLTLAQRLYQDPTRADELVTFANPVHPLFMPPQFMALAR